VCKFYTPRGYDRKVSVPDTLKQRGVDSLLSKYNNMRIIHGALCDTVACFIDGGVSWMKSAWDIFHTELIQETTQDDIFYAGFFGSFDESISLLYSAAETILGFHSINEDTPDLKEQFLPPVFGLLVLATDGRFRRYLQGNTHRVQTSSNNDQALIGGVLPGQEMAVPIALATQDWAIIRCWILEPGDSSTKKTWKLVDKRILLGCGNLVADGDVVIRKERQRVCWGGYLPGNTERDGSVTANDGTTPN
jgi:hypothetical protein